MARAASGMSRSVASAGKAGDEPNLDRVFTDAEHDRDRRGCLFRGERGRGAAGRGDNGYAAADEISDERGQAIVTSVQPVVLDRHVLALDVACFLEAFAKCS